MTATLPAVHRMCCSLLTPVAAADGEGRTGRRTHGATEQRRPVGRGRFEGRPRARWKASQGSNTGIFYETYVTEYTVKICSSGGFSRATIDPPHGPTCRPFVP